MLHHFNHSASLSLQEQFQRASTNKMFRGMVGVDIAILFLIPLTDMILPNMPCQVWILLLLFMALCVFVLLITCLSGHWDTHKQCMQLSPIISIMIIALSVSCVMGFYQNIFNEMAIIQSYMMSIVFAVLILLLAILTKLLELNYR